MKGTLGPVPVPLEPEWPGWPDGVVALFTTHRTEMVRLAHVITGSNAIAEELVQEAFLRLRQRWQSLDENPVGYLRTMVVNAAREHLRRLEVERRHTPRLQTDRVVIGSPQLDETWAAVCRLPERQRVALALRYYEDLPEVDIARILGCRVGTVKSTLHRGLRRLREELS